MIKIGITVRNRLGITRKCLEALERHTKSPYQVYLYDNETNYKLEEHISYYTEMFKQGRIAQYTVNSGTSLYNAFGKASSLNSFGANHEQDPRKSSYDFLLMLDNDCIVTPDWDTLVKDAFRMLRLKGMNHIKVVGQGGIRNVKPLPWKVKEYAAYMGFLGGSGFWAVRPNFFSDVGLLDLRKLVGHDKKHDQLYWQKLQRASEGKPYIMGLRTKLTIHTGGMAGSICNKLAREGRNERTMEIIKFKVPDAQIEAMDFDTFFNQFTGWKTNEDW